MNVPPVSNTLRRMTGGAALAEMLKLAGAGPMFGMGGFQLLPFYEACRALGLSLEALYRLRPGLDAAARFDRLGFGELTGSRKTDSWDAPVTRVEAGLVYALRRGLAVKAVYQYNWRSAGPRGRNGFPAVQVGWRF